MSSGSKNEQQQVVQHWCVCGHRIQVHKYNREIEEMDGCQMCTNCPSIEAWFEGPSQRELANYKLEAEMVRDGETPSGHPLWRLEVNGPAWIEQETYQVVNNVYEALIYPLDPAASTEAGELAEVVRRWIAAGDWAMGRGRTVSSRIEDQGQGQEQAGILKPARRKVVSYLMAKTGEPSESQEVSHWRNAVQARVDSIQVLECGHWRLGSGVAVWRQCWACPPEPRPDEERQQAEIEAKFGKGE